MASELYRVLSWHEISLETQIRSAEVSSRLQSPSQVYTFQRRNERHSIGAKRAFKASLCGILSECRFTLHFQNFHLFAYGPASSTLP